MDNLGLGSIEASAVCSFIFPFSVLKVWDRVWTVNVGPDRFLFGAMEACGWSKLDPNC